MGVRPFLIGKMLKLLLLLLFFFFFFFSFFVAENVKVTTSVIAFDI